MGKGGVDGTVRGGVDSAVRGVCLWGVCPFLGGCACESTGVARWDVVCDQPGEAGVFWGGA